MTRNDVIRLIDDLDGAVNNGGFDQYFFNSTGDEVSLLLQALETVDAKAVIPIVLRACGKFPGGMPPADRKARMTMLVEPIGPKMDFDAEDDEYYAVAEELRTLLRQYKERTK